MEIDNKSKDKKFNIGIFDIFLVIGLLLVFAYNFVSAPMDNKDVIIHISNSQSVDSITEELKNKRVIRNEFILKSFIKLLKSGEGVISGDYLIKANTHVWTVAWQIGRGHHKLDQIKVTLREGLTNEQIANILADKLAGFRKDLFMSLVQDKQGYLFPDTYFFFPLDTADEIFDKLNNNFNNKIKEIESILKSRNESLENIIIMASILEGEAKGKDDIYIISGILWKRIAMGMPLQVDVDKTTYFKKGLPDNPLNNPGILSIEAATNPKISNYLYYLHDKDGNVHYAKNYEEHKKNIKTYLK